MSELDKFIKEWKPIADIAFLTWILTPGGSRCPCPNNHSTTTI